MHPTVTAVQVIPPYGLRLTFEDGTIGVATGSADVPEPRSQLDGFAPLQDWKSPFASASPALTGSDARKDAAPTARPTTPASHDARVPRTGGDTTPRLTARIPPGVTSR